MTKKMNMFTYTTNGDAITITGYKGSGEVVVIPDTIDGLPVTAIGEYAFSGCTGLTEVVIPDSVATIGSNAFCLCTGLTEVVIPDSVTTIGSWAFSRCTGLTEVVMGSGVTSIGDWAFAYCPGLTVFTPPKEK